MIYLPIGSKLKRNLKIKNNIDFKFKCYIIETKKGFCGLYYEHEKLKEEFCIDIVFKNKQQKFINIVIELYKQFKNKFNKGSVIVFTDNKLLIDTFNKLKSDKINNFINLINLENVNYSIYSEYIENYNSKLSMSFLETENENIKSAIQVYKDIHILSKGGEIVILR